jgi:uncharacterized membrane protein YjgN (DUF898 family)
LSTPSNIPVPHLGFFVLVLIVLSGGAAIPLLGFSAAIYLLVFLVHLAVDAWKVVAGPASEDGSAQEPAR